MDIDLDNGQKNEDVETFLLDSLDVSQILPRINSTGRWGG